MRRSSIPIYGVITAVLFGLAAMELGCDGTPEDVAASKSAAIDTPSGLVTLPADESSRVGLV
ncbi:MAG TPA: hypothetical protein VLY63_20255, partial [Anaerolineae bacterium]|nr:hypothetical protein [Anaerolineae bacterium]